MGNALGGTGYPDDYPDDFAIAVGEAAQDAVWSTPHQLPLHFANDDPRRERYLRDQRHYHLSVGRQVLAVIENLRARQQDGVTTVPLIQQAERR